jgi:hypothetical protein
MRRLVLLVNCAAVACGPSAGGARTDNVPVPPAERVVRLVADTSTYVAVSHHHVEQDFQGQQTANDVATRTWLSVTLAPATGDTLAARVVVDSVDQTGGGLGPADLAAVRGATYTARLAPTGQLVDLTGDDGPGLHSQLTRAVRDFYPRLPEGGARVGVSWSDTTERDTDAGGVMLTVRAVNQHAAAGFTMWSGQYALRLVTRSDYTMTGEGSQAGQPLTFEGSGRRHLEEYLTAEGRFLGSVAADTARFDVLLTALGMAIPGRQTSVDTIRVVR